MEQNRLTLNLLNFSHSSPTLGCYLTPFEVPNSVRLSERDSVFFVQYMKLQRGISSLYTTFDVPCEGGIFVNLRTYRSYPDADEKLWSFTFLKNYYTYKLSSWFTRKGFAVRTNLITDTEVWIPGVSVYPNCRGFKSFRLRVQFGRVTGMPELLVSYEGVHSVYNESIVSDTCQELDPHLYSWLFFENSLFRYEDMPDYARRRADVLFPCLNKNLQKALKIPFPAPDKSNRYLRYRNEIENFRKTYLMSSEIAEFMLLEDEWTTREAYTLQMETRSLNKLVFGNGEVHTEPKNGMKLYGPKELPVNRKTIFFFICHRNDIDMAKAINGYMNGKISGFAGINSYAGIVYSTIKNLSIYFDDKEDPLPEIVRQLNERTFENDASYVALYLSPFGKWDGSDEHKALYYRLKEELLHRKIVSQTIEVEKNWTDRQTDSEKKAILKAGFNFAFPNIAVALLAKLGGTPWCLDNELTNELVIGISAFKSDDMEHKFLGSAFSFSGQGSFCGFDCFRSNQIDELAGSVILAVKQYCAEHTNLDKLIIHFYKTLSWKELEPIEKGLAGLGLKVPVVVVSINKTFSQDVVAFDMQQTQLMPYSFTYLPVGCNQYLLYNNGLMKDMPFDVKEGYPFPLKVAVRYFPVGSKQPDEVDESLIPPLFEQICRFSQLYWKSISRQPLPVTLRYPEMLAQIVPNFTRPELPRTGKETLWFL
jgi:hypothetical protein